MASIFADEELKAESLSLFFLLAQFLSFFMLDYKQSVLASPHFGSEASQFQQGYRWSMVE